MEAEGTQGLSFVLKQLLSIQISKIVVHIALARPLHTFLPDSSLLPPGLDKTC